MVTVMLRVADDSPLPVIVNVQAPAATGVIVYDDPAAGAMVAIPLHDFC
jgi:hypothetical protein